MAVVVDLAGVAGRQIFLGFMDYAWSKPNWSISRDVHAGVQTPWHRLKFDALASNVPIGPRFKLIAESARTVVNLSNRLLSPNVPTVCIDDREIGRLAARHFLERGFRRFGFHGVPYEQYAQARLESFSEELAKFGHECQVFPWPTKPTREYDYDPEPRWEAARRWLRSLEKPIAILAANDFEGSTLLQICRDEKIHVPREVAIVSVDNDDLLCPSTYPPLSSVDPRFRQLGYEGARLLDALLAGQAPPEKPILIEPRGVVARQSSDILAIEDENLAESLRLIRQHACEAITIEQVLQQVPVNRRWLERRFREVLGHSPRQEITRLRLERARELLSDSNCTISEVGERCGFSYTQNFEQFFRHCTGMSPSAYRNKFRRAQMPG